MRHTAWQTVAHEIPRSPIAAPSPTRVGVEMTTLAELRSRATEADLRRPQRLTSHQLLTLTDGSLWRSVDFIGYILTPGDWLWVRPGQVQQWGDLATAEGALIRFEPGFLDPGTAAAARLDDHFAPTVRQPGRADRDALAGAVRHLRTELDSGHALPPEVHTALLRHVLAALVLRLAHVTTPGDTSADEPSEAYLRFRQAVEHDFLRTHRVEDYAHALGYSPRTLSRATTAAAGIGAKEFIDRRVILEAKRLLAYSDRSAARIATHLGFADAANFAKYFHQRTGTTPIAFRASVRGEGGED